MPNIDFETDYPRRSFYLSGADLGGESHAVTIEKVEMEEMRSPKDKKTMVVRPVLYVVGHSKGLILTKDSDDGGQEQTKAAQQLVAIHGKNSDGWIGKAITFYPEDGEAFGRPFCAVRIGAPTSAPAKPADPSPKPPPDLNPAQTKFVATMKELWPSATPDEKKQHMIKAARVALGLAYVDWDGKDWLLLTPIQLNLVENQMRADKQPKTDDDGMPPPIPLDDIPF